MNVPKGLARGDDGFVRCWWCGEHEDHRHYHDHEWGRPVHEDTRLFEKICLEGFQSGLSWLTILRKREGFREAFHGFDFERVARMTARDVDRLVENAAIVRHRQKIESTIHNAKRARELASAHGSLDAYFWKFVPPASERPKRMIHEELVRLGKTETSIRLSKDLKKRGWSFVGPTTIYAFM